MSGNACVVTQYIGKNGTGIDAGNYMTTTREATEIIRALLREEVVDYQGEQFQ